MIALGSSWKTGRGHSGSQPPGGSVASKTERLPTIPPKMGSLTIPFAQFMRIATEFSGLAHMAADLTVLPTGHSPPTRLKTGSLTILYLVFWKTIVETCG